MVSVGEDEDARALYGAGFVSLAQSRDTWEEGRTTWELLARGSITRESPPSDQPVDMSVQPFSDYLIDRGDSSLPWVVPLLSRHSWII